ncbi:hypothetical protein [Paraburkholderia diazotrophica]|uniref:hypothetical protein n=1 Tax=Paraburkholderia diazotrophica TaxID=667676 RepID=UPI00317FC11D
MFDEIILKMEAAIAALIGLIRAGHPLCGTVSGKDSTCATILMLEAVRRIDIKGEVQPSHFISTADTTIENSSLARHIETMLEAGAVGYDPCCHAITRGAVRCLDHWSRHTDSRATKRCTKRQAHPCMCDSYKVRPIGIDTGIRIALAGMRERRAASRLSISRRPRSSRSMRKRRVRS